jgi:hypothetical protein
VCRVVARLAGVVGGGGVDAHVGHGREGG